jgi:selenide,water dikinase
VLSDLPVPADERVVVDFQTADDAGVYTWASGPALVQTVDFFTPIVDDPFVYGQIAAANAVSDVYAMGGRPLTALAIAGFPLKDGPDLDTMKAIFRGGFEKLREAGVTLLGGHTVQDQEIKFGYAVTGEIDPTRVLRNAGAQPGDVLFLTKPLGTGVIATAIKFQRAPEEAVRAAIASMTMLNKAAAEVLRGFGHGRVHACTDITGFGLIGHASEMAAASGCTIEFRLEGIPAIPGALALASKNVPGGGKANREYFGGRVTISPAADQDRVTLLYDPQTSGGLLISVGADDAEPLAKALEAAGILPARVGRVLPHAEPLIIVI